MKKLKESKLSKSSYHTFSEPDLEEQKVVELDSNQQSRFSSIWNAPRWSMTASRYLFNWLVSYVPSFRFSTSQHFFARQSHYGSFLAEPSEIKSESVVNPRKNFEAVLASVKEIETITDSITKGFEPERMTDCVVGMEAYKAGVLAKLEASVGNYIKNIDICYRDSSTAEEQEQLKTLKNYITKENVNLELLDNKESIEKLFGENSPFYEATRQFLYAYNREVGPEAPYHKFTPPAPRVY